MPTSFSAATRSGKSSSWRFSYSAAWPGNRFLRKAMRSAIRLSSGLRRRRGLAGHALERLHRGIADVLEVAAIGGYGRRRVAPDKRLGNFHVLADAVLDYPRHGAGDATHVEADVIQSLCQRRRRAVVGRGIERLVKFDVDQAEGDRVVMESAPIERQLQDARPLFVAGTLGAKANQLAIDDRARLEVLVDIVVGEGKHGVERGNQPARRQVRDGVAPALP